MKTMKIAAVLALALVLFSVGVIAANKYNAPTSIIHVVTIKWKPEATAEQKKAALDGVKKMASEIPGITNVWIKGTKVQPSGYSDAFVIEFKDRAAADAYATHPAHAAWEKIYLPIRAQSTSHQITN